MQYDLQVESTDRTERRAKGAHFRDSSYNYMAMLVQKLSTKDMSTQKPFSMGPWNLV